MSAVNSVAAGIVERHIEQAEAAVLAAAGSVSLCTVSRSGVPMPGVKYPEGAWVALRDVRRSMHSTDHISGDISDDVTTVVQKLSAKWAMDLERHREAGSGPDWISYCTGGVDALAALAESLPPSSGTSAD